MSLLDGPILKSEYIEKFNTYAYNKLSLKSNSSLDQIKLAVLETISETLDKLLNESLSNFNWPENYALDDKIKYARREFRSDEQNEHFRNRHIEFFRTDLPINSSKNRICTQTVIDFVDHYCIITEKQWTPTKTLYNFYCDWVEKLYPQSKPISINTFGKTLAKHKYKKYSGSASGWYIKYI